MRYNCSKVDWVGTDMALPLPYLPEVIWSYGSKRLIVRCTSEASRSRKHQCRFIIVTSAIPSDQEFVTQTAFFAVQYRRNVLSNISLHAAV